MYVCALKTRIYIYIFFFVDAVNITNLRKKQVKKTAKLVRVELLIPPPSGRNLKS